MTIATGGLMRSVSLAAGRQSLRVLIWLVTVTLLTACAGPFKQWGAETSLVSKGQSFDLSLLDHEQVAVLNAIVGLGLEGYTHQVSRSLSGVLAQSKQPMKVITTLDTLTGLNQAGLASEYAGAVTEYLRTGILNRAVLEKIGRALESRYVFQPIMAAFSQSMSGRFSFFGLRIFQTRVTQLRLSVQLWDTRTGAIVWEASGEATLAGEDVRELRIPFEEIAQHLWERMLKDLWT